MNSASTRVARPPERLVLIALLGLGFFFPTSRSGNISTGLVVLHQLMFCAIVLWLGLKRDAFGSQLQLWNASFIVVWCTAATVLSPFSELAIGAASVYFTMACLFALDVSHLESFSATALFRGVTVLVLAAAVAVFARNARVDEFLLANYSFAYADLLPTMLALQKPVFTFGSHSLAGFFYFLLFYLSFETYRAHKTGVDLAIAVCCILAGALLASITSAVLMSWALVLLLLRGGRARLPLLGAFALSLVVIAWRFQNEIGDFVAVSNMLAALEFQGSGLSGRFGGGGNLLNNLELIRAQPFRPTGLSYSASLFFGDSGPVEYLLRGSLPLLVGVYGGFALFLWKNLRMRRHAFMLFAVTFAFEVGMSVLTYHRFAYFLVFAVFYLNSLASHRETPRGSPSTVSVVVETPT